MRSSLRIYEHQLVRVGHPLDGGGPTGTFSQLHVEALARYNDEHGGNRFRIGYRSFTATQFVGYVEVDDLCIEILPKTDRDQPAGDDGRWRNALLEMLRVVTGLDLWTPSLASQQTTRTTLMELVAVRFLYEVEALLHAGLARSYRDEESNGSVMRGKLVFTQHLRENAARADRYVRHATFDRDIPVNRLLARTLDVLAHLPLGGDVPSRTRAAREAMGELSSIGTTAYTFDRLQLGRSTARYRDALIIARMILEQLSPSLRSGPAPVLALLFDMNVLWERYVFNVLHSMAGPEWDISRQDRLAFWQPTGSNDRVVRPDIVVRDARTRAVVLVADTKWKVVVDGHPSDDDLKQMFVYNELMKCPRAVLIYPHVNGATVRGGRFESRGHSCETFYETVPERGAPRSAALSELLVESAQADPSDSR